MNKCLFLVEGPYDLQRLALLKLVFDSNKLEIVPLAGDKLTTKNYYKDYKSIITFYLTKESTHLYEDFDFFAQICDTDGCFIDDELLLESKAISSIKYYRNYIEVSNVGSKRSQNAIKVENIISLLAAKDIELYYNSCNIDDAFNNMQNPSKKQKKQLAISMYGTYKDNLRGFIDLLFASDRSNTKSFNESWNYIKSGTNSLSSTSNLKFFLLRHLDDLKDEFRAYILEAYESSGDIELV